MYQSHCENVNVNRDGSVDVYKGMGIILMLVGHVGLWGDYHIGYTHFICRCFSLFQGICLKKKM